MKFPATLGKRNLIVVPRNIVKDMDLEYGDAVYVEIVKKDSIEQKKATFDKHWEKGN